MQADLFGGAGDGTPQAEVQPPVLFVRDWIPPDEVEGVMAGLRSNCRWASEEIAFGGGKKVVVPRLIAYQGDAGRRYRYSGVSHEPDAWCAESAALRQRLQGECLALQELNSGLAGLRFNTVLLNLYRGGTDSMGWHADAERELGADPVIASVSLGQTRTFEMRHKATRKVHRLELTSGSLLVMRAGMQSAWDHQVPKQPERTGERINLTFRWVI